MHVRRKRMKVMEMDLCIVSCRIICCLWLHDDFIGDGEPKAPLTVVGVFTIHHIEKSMDD